MTMSVESKSVEPGSPASGAERESERESRLDARSPESPSASGDEVYEEEEAPRNPFDNPLFLPILLLGLTLWFGYDAFLNDDPEMRKHLLFNRVGFTILVPLLLYFGYRARQEIRAAREDGTAD